MEQRINAFENGQGAMKSLYAMGAYLSKSSLEKPLLNLIYFRVSQLNGCAFCLDMHSKDLRHGGETEQRLYMLNAWRDAPLYSEREQMALSWAEAVTELEHGQVSDEIYNAVSKEFSEAELIDLTLAVIAINSYNRINIAFRTPAGSYKPNQYAVHNS